MVLGRLCALKVVLGRLRALQVTQPVLFSALGSSTQL
jgi:hypothetical protein